MKKPNKRRPDRTRYTIYATRSGFYIVRATRRRVRRRSWWRK